MSPLEALVVLVNGACIVVNLRARRKFERAALALFEAERDCRAATAELVVAADHRAATDELAEAARGWAELSPGIVAGVACPVCAGPVMGTPSGALTCFTYGDQHWRRDVVELGDLEPGEGATIAIDADGRPIIHRFRQGPRDN